MTGVRYRAPAADTVVGDRIVRFDLAERLTHWVSAMLLLACAGTGLVLYVNPLAAAIGRRALLKEIHVLAGVGSVIPFLLAWLGPWRGGLRRDLRRFARWHDDDVRWFRRSTRHESETGKFNGGQKANAVAVGSLVVVMLMTGSVMRWFGPFPLSWRTGATFVHDWGAVALWILIPAHIIKAAVTTGAVRGMWTGWQPRSEAALRPRWWSEIGARR